MIASQRPSRCPLLVGQLLHGLQKRAKILVVLLALEFKMLEIGERRDW